MFKASSVRPRSSHVIARQLFVTRILSSDVPTPPGQKIGSPTIAIKGAGPDLYPGAEVYGAESVRIDVSYDGVAWTEGAVYTSSNSGLDAGDYRSETLEAACFPLANATNANLTNVEGRFVRLVFGVGFSFTPDRLFVLQGTSFAEANPPPGEDAGAPPA